MLGHHQGICPDRWPLWLLWSQGGAPVLALQPVGFSTVLPQTERTPFGVLSFPC